MKKKIKSRKKTVTRKPTSRDGFGEIGAKLGATPTPAALEEHKKAREEAWSEIGKALTTEKVSDDIPTGIDMKFERTEPAHFPLDVSKYTDFKIETIKYPANWWEAVKDRFVPVSWRARFPARYVSRQVWVTEGCIHQEVDDRLHPEMERCFGKIFDAISARVPIESKQ